MNERRKAILMYVPDDVRTRVYDDVVKKKGKWLSHSVPWLGVIFMLCILWNITPNVPYIWGYITGCFMIAVSLLYVGYKYTGYDWRPPSIEDKNELR